MTTEPALSKEAGIEIEVNWSKLTGWQAEQLREIIGYCVQRNWQLLKINEHQSRALEPLITVWKVTFSVRGKPKDVWFINGNLPIDFIPFKSAQNARDALLCFSRKFLHQAQILKQDSTIGEQSFNDPSKGNSNKDSMKKLVKAAADLLVFYHENKMWDEK